MKQIAIIGLSHFGRRVLDELLQYDVEVLLIDRDREVIEESKDQVAAAYIADAIREELIQKLVPETIDAAIIDLGDATEASILVTNYLKKHGIKRIIAKAETDQHGEILAIVGATDVVYPNREAAKRIALPLISSSLFSFFPIGEGMVIAEIQLPEQFFGQTVVEADLRRRHGLNVLAVRRSSAAQFDFISPAYEFAEGDVILALGREKDIAGIPSEAGTPSPVVSSLTPDPAARGSASRPPTRGFFSRLFGRDRRSLRHRR